MYPTDLYRSLKNAQQIGTYNHWGNSCNRDHLEDMSDLKPFLIEEMQPGDSCIIVDTKTWSGEGGTESPFVKIGKGVLNGKTGVTTYRIPLSLSSKMYSVKEREEHAKGIEEYYQHFSRRSCAFWICKNGLDLPNYLNFYR